MSQGPWKHGHRGDVTILLTEEESCKVTLVSGSSA
jgi:hypothetical protein